jgi:hypothetical protein
MAFETLDPAVATNPSAAQAARFAQLRITGGFSMINLHEYHDIARYPEGYKDAPVNVSGREAYGRYVKAIRERFMPQEPGFRLVELPVETVMIGPGNWHEAVISIYPSHAAVLRIPTLPGFAEIAVHRTAALKRALVLAVSGDMHDLCKP